MTFLQEMSFLETKLCFILASLSIT